MPFGSLGLEHTPGPVALAALESCRCQHPVGPGPLLAGRDRAGGHADPLQGPPSAGGQADKLAYGGWLAGSWTSLRASSTLKTFSVHRGDSPVWRRAGRTEALSPRHAAQVSVSTGLHRVESLCPAQTSPRGCGLTDLRMCMDQGLGSRLMALTAAHRGAGFLRVLRQLHARSLLIASTGTGGLC